jgi:hypothetical protein
METLGSEKFAVLWDTAPCGFTGVDRRFRIINVLIIRARLDVVSYKLTDVSEALTASIRVDDKGSKHL